MEQTEYDGYKVKFRNGHPHAGETGVILGAQRTLIGLGFRVKIENCAHGVEECFFFKSIDVDMLPKGRNK